MLNSVKINSQSKRVHVFMCLRKSNVNHFFYLKHNKWHNDNMYDTAYEMAKKTHKIHCVLLLVCILHVKFQHLEKNKMRSSSFLHKHINKLFFCIFQYIHSNKYGLEYMSTYGLIFYYVTLFFKAISFSKAHFFTV